MSSNIFFNCHMTWNTRYIFIYNILMQISEAESITFAVNDTGTATVADINHLQNLIDGKVNTIDGDVSATVVNNPIANEDSFPVPVAGDSIAVIVRKIIKFFIYFFKSIYISY